MKKWIMAACIAACGGDGGRMVGGACAPPADPLTVCADARYLGCVGGTWRELPCPEGEQCVPITDTTDAGQLQGSCTRKSDGGAP